MSLLQKGRVYSARMQEKNQRDSRFGPPSGDDNDDFLGSLKVHHVGNKVEVIWVNPVVEGKTLKMELDTGSALSVIPWEKYKKHFGQLKQEKSQVVLKTYTGEKITPKYNVNFKGQEHNVSLQVVDTSGPALFGRDWLSKIHLDWGEIKALKLDQTPAHKIISTSCYRYMRWYFRMTRVN